MKCLAEHCSWPKTCAVFGHCLLDEGPLWNTDRARSPGTQARMRDAAEEMSQTPRRHDIDLMSYALKRFKRDD